MKALKYIIVSIVVLGLIFVGFGYMQDQNVSVSRSIIVAAPVSPVFDQFNDLNKRLVWSPWEKNDSTMNTTLGEIKRGVGASYSWTSENSGEGTISYAEVVENQLIESKLFFGSEDPAQGLMIFSEVEDGTKVTWEVHMDFGSNPFSRLMGRYMDDMIGPTFESGLQSVKEIVETEMELIAQNDVESYEDVTIQVLDVESKPCISILDSCSLAEMTDRFGDHYSALGAFVGKNQLKVSGSPQSLYHKWEPPTKVVFEPLFTLESPTDILEDGISIGQTYAGRVITTTHIGPYENAAHYWEALDAYLISNNLEVNGSPWEQYENTPETEPDPNKLITHIFMPIK